tara:strand:- start:319 stop:507 length:189 start_codon:yes stop_codon:yes gene_type:complete
MKIMHLIAFRLRFQGFEGLVGQGLLHVSSFRMTLQQSWKSANLKEIPDLRRTCIAKMQRDAI